MRGSIKSQVNAVLKQIDGIGISKAESRFTSLSKNLTGSQSVSNLIHAYEYRDEIFKTATQLAQYAKEEFKIKDVEKINSEVVRDFIQSKIEQGLTKGTLDNYISHLAKFQIGLQHIAEARGKEYSAFNKEDLLHAKEIIKQEAVRTAHENRAYSNPNAIISNLNDKEFIAAKLQLEHGLRITEATKIRENQLQGNTLSFIGKGGYTLTKELSQELARDLRNSFENGVFKVNQDTFREHLKEACEIEGEKYTGAHGLRYNYAQNTFIKEFDKNIERGLTPAEAEKIALKETSEKMGHHREEITKHYL